MSQMLKVVKKDNTIESFNAEKIKSAVKKAAFRCDKVIDADHLNQIADEVYSRVEHRDQVTVAELHEMVIAVLAFLQYKEVPKLGYRNTESPGKFFKMSSARGHLFLTHTYFYDII